MSAFVLDNSVAMRWFLPTNRIADQEYANKILEALGSTAALVPNLWHLEASSVLLSAIKRGDASAGEAEAFMLQLDNLPIEVDALTASQAFTHGHALAKTFGLTSYDAAYLELASRKGLPLASLDKDLRRAARKASVSLYLDE